MSKEIDLTAALSTLLDRSPWKPAYEGSEFKSRFQSLFVPEALGYVTMQQNCRSADLDKWHNHIRVQGYQDARIAEFNWDRDLEAEIQDPEAVWTLLHQVEDRIYETG
jgi:hypothetical protein